MYTPRGCCHFSLKIWLKFLRSHYTYHFYIMDASPKQLNAPEDFGTNTVRPTEMVYIALPSVAW